MENIIACVRIKPVSFDENDELVCGKFEENSVLNTKNNERYDFGIKLHYHNN